MDPTLRFSNRVDAYVKSRPGYPAALREFLAAELGLTQDAIIADIGSGTGLLTRLFLENGNVVYGVEPNEEMRDAGEDFLSGFSDFISINATAETTTLANTSIDFVVAGQAFHWFDTEKFQAECRRILKPTGWIVLVWNERRVQATPLSREYEAFIETWNTDFTEVTRRRWTEVDEGFDAFFGPNGWRTVTFDNPQTFTWELFAERVKSSSYLPPPSDDRHAPMMNDLRALFDRYKQDGIVVFDQDTHAYYGRPRK